MIACNDSIKGVVCGNGDFMSIMASMGLWCTRCGRPALSAIGLSAIRGLSCVVQCFDGSRIHCPRRIQELIQSENDSMYGFYLYHA